MAARSILNFVAVFPNFDYDITITPNDFYTVDPSMSYYDKIDGDNVLTLSTNSAVDSPIQGLLYVPDLDTDDPCSNLSSPYVPASVTRQIDLPATDYNIIAMAPWINADCTRSYLAAANLDPIRAFIFYHPDNKSTLPSSNDSQAWSLGDGGAWKQTNRWPVYGVPGTVGSQMMTASGEYSGNMTSVPNGHDLSMRYDSRDYVRIYTQITTTSSTSLSTLWIFLLVILACLIVILTFISLSMHWFQRRGRESLRRRVASGEVDLEALGIRRLTVPKELIDSFPLFIYICGGEGADIAKPRLSRLSLKTDALHDIQEVDSSGHDLNFSLPSPTPSASTAFEAALSPPNPTRSHDSAVVARRYKPGHQPACPICLDDYESSITAIRELPCGHIFHPECIDSFLNINSSLCPLCKKSVLPSGYCPGPITNSMVRRELMVRRIRSRVNMEIDESDNVNTRRRRFLRFGRRIASPRLLVSQPNFRLRVQEPDDVPTQSGEEQRQGAQAPNSGTSRQEIARRRIPQLIGESAIEDLDMEIEARTPAWRKVFPGFT